MSLENVRSHWTYHRHKEKRFGVVKPDFHYRDIPAWVLEQMGIRIMTYYARKEDGAINLIDIKPVRRWKGILKVRKLDKGNLCRKLRYKRYKTTVYYSPEDRVFHGKIENIPDLVSFEGHSMKAAKLDFKKAVNRYIDWCKEDAKCDEAIKNSILRSLSSITDGHAGPPTTMDGER